MFYIRKWRPIRIMSNNDNTVVTINWNEVVNQDTRSIDGCRSSGKGQRAL